jgi:hypothetical protein
MKAIGVVSLTVLALALSATANATTLATGAVAINNGDVTHCYVTNIGTKPLTVTTVAMVTLDGSSAAEIDDCTGRMISPNHSCEFENVDGVPGAFYCTATANGSFRLMLNAAGSGGGNLRAVPGTK